MATLNNTHNACRALLNLLQTEWPDLHRQGRRYWPHEVKTLRQIMLDDLFTKSKSLRADQFATIQSALKDYHILSDAARTALETKSAGSLGKSNGIQGTRKANAQKDSGSPRIIADIIILTVLPVERDAVLVAFEQNPRRKEDWRDSRGNRFYKFHVNPTQGGGPPLVAWLAMVGRPRNDRCAIFVKDLTKEFEFGSIVLLGIAGGNSDKVDLGDVVASTEILDDDGGVDAIRLGFEIRGKWYGKKRHEPRIETITCNGSSANLLNGFSADEDKWHKALQSIIGAGNIGALKFDTDDAATPTKYHIGMIQSGDRLKRDGQLPITSKNYHGKLYAVEMEGRGFARASESEDLEWLVVRGISDFGDPKKRDKKQALASVSAALFLRQFLEDVFQPPENSDDLTF